MGARYPLSIENERILPDGYNGPVFIWDIDKTYLSTHFSSMHGLARIPFESAVDKKAIPGMSEVLRGLRRGPGPGVACRPLYFVSASPPQLRNVLKQRMLLDGVEYDGITSKDWLGAFLQFRPGRLHEQVGFKLCALLTNRGLYPLAREYLFGDDFEKDATAYSFYARLITGKLSAGDADEEMRAEGVKSDDRRCVFDLLEGLVGRLGAVERAFINLEQKTPPEEFKRFGDLVVPVKNGFQLALALFELKLLDREAVRQARKSVARGAEESIDDSITDARARGLITLKTVRALNLGPRPARK